LILAANGETLARSVKIADAAPGTRQYYRTYTTGPLYSSFIGYTTPFYTNSGVERVYNKYLSLHTQPKHTLEQLLTRPGRPPTT
jgi:hypothetical protein